MIDPVKGVVVGSCCCCGTHLYPFLPQAEEQPRNRAERNQVAPWPSFRSRWTMAESAPAARHTDKYLLSRVGPRALAASEQVHEAKHRSTHLLTTIELPQPEEENEKEGARTGDSEVGLATEGTVTSVSRSVTARGRDALVSAQPAPGVLSSLSSLLAHVVPS